MKKPKLFTNQDRTSYRLWWFTNYKKKHEIHSKEFQTQEEAEQYEEIYNQVIQNYSHLQYEYEGNELQDKINEIVDKTINQLNK